MRLYRRFSLHPWGLEATVGARPIGPNEVAWLEEVAAALAGTGLTGAETLDVAAALVGQVRMVAQQAAEFGTDSREQALNATLGVLAGHKDRFPRWPPRWPIPPAPRTRPSTLGYNESSTEWIC